MNTRWLIAAIASTGFLWLIANMSRNPQTEDKYVVRFPDGMRDHLKEMAAKNNRSLNAEIVHRLAAFDELLTEIAYLRDNDLQNESIINRLTGMAQGKMSAPNTVRLSDELAGKIAAAARRMNRTTEAQALDTLEKSYLPPSG